MPYLKELGRQNTLDLIKLIEWNAAHHIYFLRGASCLGLLRRAIRSASGYFNKHVVFALLTRLVYRSLVRAFPLRRTSRLPVLARVCPGGADTGRRDSTASWRPLDLASWTVFAAYVALLRLLCGTAEGKTADLLLLCSRQSPSGRD
jgi:hypothetical protein